MFYVFSNDFWYGVSSCYCIGSVGPVTLASLYSLSYATTPQVCGQSAKDILSNMVLVYLTLCANHTGIY